MLSISRWSNVFTASVAALLCVGCGQWLVEGEGQRACKVRVGDSPAAVLNECGLPSGYRVRPKVSTGWLPPKVCSGAIYLYGRQAIAFDCDSKVSSVQTADGFGVVPDESYLIEQLVAGRHGEAACVELGKSPAPSATAVDTLERAGRADDVQLRRAAKEALERIAQRC